MRIIINKFSIFQSIVLVAILGACQAQHNHYATSSQSFVRHEIHHEHAPVVHKIAPVVYKVAPVHEIKPIVHKVAVPVAHYVVSSGHGHQEHHNSHNAFSSQQSSRHDVPSKAPADHHEYYVRIILLIYTSFLKQLMIHDDNKSH